MRSGVGEDRTVDVVIVTALKDELDAVLAIGAGWSERRDVSGFPYHQQDLARGEGKPPLRVAAAWLGKMGEAVAAMRGGALLLDLEPACIAMCGICAGPRGEVALGDVIVADALYSYDHGKSVAEPGREVELRQDIRTFNLHPLWRMGGAYVTREIDLPSLQKARPLSKEAQVRWLLHAQLAHEAGGGPLPATHAEQETACPDWTASVDDALASRPPSGRPACEAQFGSYPVPC